MRLDIGSVACLSEEVKCGEWSHRWKVFLRVKENKAKFTRISYRLRPYVACFTRPHFAQITAFKVYAKKVERKKKKKKVAYTPRAKHPNCEPEFRSGWPGSGSLSRGFSPGRSRGRVRGAARRESDTSSGSNLHRNHSETRRTVRCGDVADKSTIIYIGMNARR